MNINFIQILGGRKTILGICYLLCCTFLVNAMIIGPHQTDFLGLASTIGAMSVGIGSIMWANVKQHEFENNSK